MKCLWPGCELPAHNHSHRPGLREMFLGVYVRKITALSATADFQGRHTVWAACDDGTFWQFDPHHAEKPDAWMELPPIPQPEKKDGQ